MSFIMKLIKGAAEILSQPPRAKISKLPTPRRVAARRDKLSAPQARKILIDETHFSFKNRD